MGAWIDFTNHVHIAEKTFNNGLLSTIGYKDITSETLDNIAANNKIEMVQINGALPHEAYPVIDKIFERRGDLYFRIFGIHGDNPFDLSVLKLMPHLERVWIDAHCRENKDAVNAQMLTELPNLKGLHLNLFDRRDYSFMKELSPELEELVLNIDTMSGSGNFDCAWLANYPKIKSLWLAKHAKKHIESIAELTELKSLALRGIGLKESGFLKKMSLEKFRLLNCKSADISWIGDMKTLREVELWRIMGLENVDFLKELPNLEVIRLQDLSHIKALPDLGGLKNLKKIMLDNVPIDTGRLDDSVKKLICPWETRS